jgi:hypothetical protein
VANEVDPGRFRSLNMLLAKAESLKPESALHSLARGGCSGTEADLQVLWRSLMVAHQSSEIRRQAARLVSLKTLWALLVHPVAPLWVILETALRIVPDGNQDRQKLLFDCTRSRIAKGLQSDLRDDFEDARTVLLLLYSHTALAEEGYWDRLESLRDLFKKRAAKFGYKSDDLESRRDWLAERRPARVLAFQKSPRLVEELPHKAQRDFAREGLYLDHCVEQRDLIAFETFPHLRPQNLVHLLTPRFNPRLLQRLCRERTFCAEPAILGKILRHPHCPQDFAQKHVAKRSDRETHCLSVNHDASDAARSAARDQGKLSRR